MSTSSTYEQNLTDGLSHTANEISRTDAKATGLLTLDGLLVASAALVSGESVVSMVCAAIGGGALAASVLGLLAVICPRLPRRLEQGNDRAWFGYWATADSNDIKVGLSEDRRITRLRALSRVAAAKMRALQLATLTTAIAVVGIAAAIATR